MVMTKEYTVAEGQDRKQYAQKMLTLIDNNSMDIITARQCLHNLPSISHDYGYTEDVYSTCKKCLEKLWEYCKNKKYIDDIDYGEFVKHGMIHFKL